MAYGLLSLSVLIGLSLSLTLILFPYLLFERRRKKKQEDNITVFPELASLVKSKTYFIVYFFGLIFYFAILLVLSIITAAYIYIFDLGLMISIIIFIGLIIGSIFSTWFLFKLVIPKSMGKKNIKNKISNKIKNITGKPLKKDLKKLNEAKIRTEFISSNDFKEKPIVYSKNLEKNAKISDYKKTINHLDNNSNQINYTIGGGNVYALNLEEEEELKEERKEIKEQNNIDHFSGFYYLLSVLPFLINIGLGLFIALTGWKNIENPVEILFYLQMIPISVIRFIATFISITFEIGYYDKMMAERKYEKALFYNMIMGIFHLSYLLYGYYFGENVPKALYLFSYIFIIYFFKAIICWYNIYSNEKQSNINTIDILKQADRAQYSISLYFFMILLLGLINEQDLEAALILSLILIFLSPALIVIYFLVEIVIFVLISRPIQKGKPSKARVSLLINIILYFLGKFLSSDNAIIQQITIYGTIVSFIFSLPQFIDKLMELFRKRKWGYYSEKYRAKEKNVFVVNEDLESKIRNMVLENNNVKIQSNNKESDNNYNLTNDNVDLKTETEIQNDLKKLKNIQKRIAGVPPDKHRVKCDCGCRDKHLKLSITVLTNAALVTGLILGIISIFSSIYPEFFQSFYSKSLIGDLSSTNKDIFVRSTQMFEIGVEILLLTILFYGIDQFVINPAFKIKKCRTVNKLNYAIAIAYLLSFLDVCINWNHEPFILWLYVKILFGMIGIVHILKGFLINDEIDNNDHKKEESIEEFKLNKLNQLNISRILLIIMSISIIINDFSLIPLAESYYESSIFVNNWGQYIELISYFLLEYIIIIVSYFIIELIFFAVLTVNLTEKRINNIMKFVVLILSVGSLFIYNIPNFIIGLNILYYLKFPNKLDEKYAKKTKISSLQKFNNKSELKNSTNKNNIRDWPKESSEDIDKKEVPTLQVNMTSTGSIALQSAINNSYPVDDQIFFPTPLLVAVFGDAVFSISEKEKELRKIQARTEKKEILMKEKSEINEKIKEKAKEKIDNRLKRAEKIKSAKKKAIEAGKNLMKGNINGIYNINNKNKLKYTNSDEINNSEDSVNPDNQKELNEKKSKIIKIKLGEMKNKVKAIPFNKVSSFLILTFSLTFLYFIGIILTQFDNNTISWLSPPVIFIVVGLIGIIFRRRELYGITLITLIPTALMVTIDILNGLSDYFIPNLILLGMACLIFIKYKLPEFDLLIIHTILYLYTVYLFHFTFSVEYLDSYFEASPIIFNLFIICGPIISTIIAYLKDSESKFMIKKNKYKTNPSVFENILVEKFGNNSIIRNIDILLFISITTLLSTKNYLASGDIAQIFNLSYWLIIASVILLFFNNETLSSFVVSMMPSITAIVAINLIPLHPSIIGSIFIIIVGLYIILVKRDAKWDKVFLFGLLFNLSFFGYNLLNGSYISTIRDLLFITIIDTLFITLLVFIVERINYYDLKRTLLHQKNVSNDINSDIKSSDVEFLDVQNAVNIVKSSIGDYENLKNKLLSNSNDKNNPLVDEIIKWMGDKKIVITNGALEWLKRQPIYKTHILPNNLDKNIRVITSNNMDPVILKQILNNFTHTPRTVEMAKTASNAYAAGCTKIVLPDITWLFMEDFLGKSKNDNGSRGKLFEFNFVILPFNIPDINYSNLTKAQYADSIKKKLIEIIDALPNQNVEKKIEENKYGYRTRNRRTRKIDKMLKELDNENSEFELKDNNNEPKRKYRMQINSNKIINKKNHNATENEDSLTNPNITPESNTSTIIDPIAKTLQTANRLTFSLTKVITQTVFILLSLAVLYYFLEQIGIAPVLYIDSLSGFTIGENIIIFISTLGGIIALGLVAYYLIGGYQYRGLE